VWLTIRNEQEAELVGQEIADALVKYALPKLDSLSCTTKFRSFLEQATPEELAAWSLVHRDYLLQPLCER
jgi:hypothetical protein